MDRIDTLRIFARAVETSSFSRTARIEGMGQSTVSKHLAGLEARLPPLALRGT